MIFDYIGKAKQAEIEESESEETYFSDDFEVASAETRSTVTPAKSSKGKVSVPKRKPVSNEKKAAEKCRDFLNPERTCAWGEKCRFKHVDLATHEQEQKKRGACYYFFNGLDCHAGIACSYTHDHVWLTQQRAKNGPCRYYADGTCRRGDACKRSHEAKYKVVADLIRDAQVEKQTRKAVSRTLNSAQILKK